METTWQNSDLIDEDYSKPKGICPIQRLKLPKREGARKEPGNVQGIIRLTLQLQDLQV